MIKVDGITFVVVDAQQRIQLGRSAAGRRLKVEIQDDGRSIIKAGMSGALVDRAGRLRLPVAFKGIFILKGVEGGLEIVPAKVVPRTVHYEDDTV